MRPFKQLTAYVDLPCEWVSDVNYLGLTANKLAETAANLERENVKLREMVTIAVNRCHEYLCDGCPLSEHGWCLYAVKAEELGIEVE